MKKTQLIRSLFVAAAAGVASAPAFAQTIDVSTGINGGWDFTTTGNPAQVVGPSNADWYGGWVANNASSSWIAANPNSTSGNNGTYSLSFNLTGYLLSSMSLSGSWTCDDQGSLYLNGHLLGTLGTGNWGSLSSFSAPSSDFVPGVNTLSIVEGATDNFLEGVRLQPLPAPWLQSQSLPRTSPELFCSSHSVCKASAGCAARGKPPR